MQRLFVPGALPSLNDIIAAKGNCFRGGYDAYAKMKKQWGEAIALLASAQGLKRVEAGYFTYLCRERNKQRDPSNVGAGAVKLIEDALQYMGFMDNDGWSQVLGYVPHLHVDASMPGVTVFVHPERLLTKEEAIAADDDARRKLSCQKPRVNCPEN